jgi:hypothetical protein
MSRVDVYPESFRARLLDCMLSLNLLKWLFLRKIPERHDRKGSQAFIRKIYNPEVRRAQNKTIESRTLGFISTIFCSRKIGVRLSNSKA